MLFARNCRVRLRQVPDNPELGPLYLLKGLLNSVAEHPWPDSSDAKAELYIDTIALLSAYSQKSYLYGATGVELNDSLYGGSPKFIAVRASGQPQSRCFGGATSRGGPPLLWWRHEQRRPAFLLRGGPRPHSVH